MKRIENFAGIAFEMTQDPVDDPPVGNEGDDLCLLHWRGLCDSAGSS